MPSWNQFREALLRRFQPGVVKDPFGPSLRVKQGGSVMDYIEQFESFLKACEKCGEGDYGGDICKWVENRVAS